MTEQRFTIPGRLPGLNDLYVNYRCPWKARRVKEQAMQAVRIYARLSGIQPQKERVQATILCYEPNCRRDEDNVLGGACKVVLDGLVNAGILQGDGRKYVTLANCSVQVDRERPRVEVVLSHAEHVD